MERLWSPWRSRFVSSVGDHSSEVSPFAAALAAPKRDRENHLVHRGRHAFIIMNKFPYNAGHLLVVPNRQVGDFLDLDGEEYREIMELIRLGIVLLKEVLGPHGFNVGMNLGRTAGAAIDNHVHFHIVPRWNGDTNFMPVLDETRVISEEMDSIYQRLIQALGAMPAGE